MKYQFFWLVTCLALPMSNFANTKLLTFANPAIHSLDGVTYMIDGVAIHDILIVIKKIQNMLIGQKTNNSASGNYEFLGKKLSIEQLMDAEVNFSEHPELEQALHTAKHDFIETTKSFMSGIEPAKRLILDLIEEFCERRSRHDSLILSWSNAKHGNEAEIFNKNVTSFKQFGIFLNDLTLFLKDLIHSCPKACKQYREWYQKQKQSLEQ